MYSLPLQAKYAEIVYLEERVFVFTGAYYNACREKWPFDRGLVPVVGTCGAVLISEPCVSHA